MKTAKLPPDITERQREVLASNVILSLVSAICLGKKRQHRSQ